MPAPIKGIATGHKSETPLKQFKDMKFYMWTDKNSSSASATQTTLAAKKYTEG